jgi:two-component system, NarL family, nitrate/nitrite response regulator NarL
MITTNELKIMLADDHPLILEGTKSFLEAKGYSIADMCSNGEQALLYIERHHYDVAILDISMPSISGLEVARLIKEKKINTKIILLTIHNEENLFRKAIEYNVFGYILKNSSMEDLIECLECIQHDQIYDHKNLEYNLAKDPVQKEIGALSTMELKIVELIAKQHVNKEIGELLFLSERTIEWHRKNIIEKLDLPKEKNILTKWAIKNLG